MMHLSESSTSSTFCTGAETAGAAKEPGAATGVTIGGAALAARGAGVGAAGHEILSPGGTQSFLCNFQCVF